VAAARRAFKGGRVRVHRPWVTEPGMWCGAPTYVLTDNEKTVTIEHVEGIAVRNPATVAFLVLRGHGVHL
jgi:hypothetical protein